MASSSSVPALGPLTLRSLWQVYIVPLPCSPTPTPTLLLLEELLVEEENEQVDIDLGLVEHLHDCYALVLQLQQVLWERGLSPPPAPCPDRGAQPQVARDRDQHGAGFAGRDAQRGCPQQLRAGLHRGSESPQELQAWGHHPAPTYPGCPHLSGPQQLQDRLHTW